MTTHPPVAVHGHGIQIDAAEVTFAADRLDLKPGLWGVDLVASRAGGREQVVITLDSLSDLTEALVAHDSEHVADVLARHERSAS